MTRNKNPFSIDFPNELQTIRSKFIYWVMWQVYLTDLGRGQVFGKFTQLFTEVSLLLLVLDKIGIAYMSLVFICISAVLFAFLVWYAGWLYQYFEIDKIHNMLVTKRNPIVNDIYDRTKDNKKR